MPAPTERAGSVDREAVVGPTAEFPAAEPSTSRMTTPGPHEVAFAIRGPIDRSDLQGLCDRVCGLLGGAGSVMACDVAGVEPNAVTVDALARLQLAARRRGCVVRLRNASTALLDLVGMMGLTNVLAANPGFETAGDGKNHRMADYTHKSLVEVEDAAAKWGYSESQQARFAGTDLDLETLGVSYQIVKPNKHHAFGHRHKEAEEVYVVLAGSGTCRLDDDEVPVTRLDAIRVGPDVTRGFAAGPEGLELLVFSVSAPGDAEIVEDFFDR